MKKKWHVFRQVLNEASSQVSLKDLIHIFLSLVVSQKIKTPCFLVFSKSEGFFLQRIAYTLGISASHLLETTLLSEALKDVEAKVTEVAEKAGLEWISRHKWHLAIFVNSQQKSAKK